MIITQTPCTVWRFEYQGSHFVAVDDNSDDHHLFRLHDMDNDGDMDWEHVGMFYIPLRSSGMPIEDQIDRYKDAIKENLDYFVGKESD